MKTLAPLSHLRVAHSYRDAPPDPELVESVRRLGVLAPLVVAKDGEGYVVVDGRRRLRAAQEAGLEHVPVHVISGEEAYRRVVEVAANLHRLPFSPPELARAVIDLVAVRLGVSHSEAEGRVRSVARYRSEGDAEASGDPNAQLVLGVLRDLGIGYRYFFGHLLPSLGWPVDVQEAAAQGVLSVRAAKKLSRIEDEGVRREVLARVRAAKEKGVPPAVAVKVALSEVALEAGVSRLTEGLEQELPRGWRTPTGSTPIPEMVLEGETVRAPLPPVVTVPRLYDAYPIALAPLAAGYVLLGTTAQGQRVLILWGGGGELGDIASASGRSTYWVEPLGVRHEQIPEQPYEAPLPEADVALLIPPPPGAKVSHRYGTPDPGDVSAMPEERWAAHVSLAGEKAREKVREVYVVLYSTAWRLIPVYPVIAMASARGEDALVVGKLH